MTREDLSRREKIRGLIRVAMYKPMLSAFIILFSFFVALLEGVGISFLIPIIEVAQSPGDPTQEAEGAVLAFIQVYDMLGLPFTLGFLVTGIALVMTARFTCSFLVTWLQVALQTHYVRELQTNAFNGAVDAQVTYFDREGSDDILNAIVTQAEYAGKVIRDFVRFFETVLLILMYFAIAFYLAPILTIVAAVLLGLLTYVLRFIIEPGYTVGDRVADANERIQEAAQAGTQGIRDVKLFTMGEELQTKFSVYIDQFTNATIDIGRNEAAIESFYNLSAALVVFSLIYFALQFAGLSLAALGVFLFAMFRLGPAISSANYQFYKFESQLPHLIRTQQFIEELDRYEEPADGQQPVPDELLPIQFDNVLFGYEDEPVLRNVSFEIRDEEFIAFVGPSGAGKSTIAALLARLYEPDSGEITATGKAVDEYDRIEWRSRIAVVRQDPFIFDDTLRYNVTIGDREATQEDIEWACEVAHVSEFLDELPDGYETHLGDNGVRLSGGQRQRVALARALLKDADVLVLDEATSDLDTGIEERVHSAIERMETDYAIVAIAHRLSTVRGADRIYTLEDGRIIEQGNHNELLEEGGTYSDLYAMQAT
ncbi:ABC transporter ATP-binding protein [Natrialbaceae archaeon A-CW3]